MTQDQIDTVATTLIRTAASLESTMTIDSLEVRTITPEDFRVTRGMLYEPRRTALPELLQSGAVAMWLGVTEGDDLHSTVALINPDGEIIAAVEVQ